jgi:hypothetical protein
MTEANENMMELASGNYFDFSNPGGSVFLLDDIAQGLANSCRFNGQCSRFYSVAEHAVGVATRLADQGYSLDIQLAGLHHDDSEAFISDIPRPAKLMLRDYVKLEARVMRAVTQRLGLDHLDFHAPEVKAADNWMLAQEAGEILPSQCKGPLWEIWHPIMGATWDGQQRGLGVSPVEAQILWLARHEFLIESAMVEA